MRPFSDPDSLNGVKRLLVIGGGHGHVEVVRRFGSVPPRGTDVILISPDRYTPYSGMPLIRYSPQLRTLALISTGGRHTVAS